MWLEPGQTRPRAVTPRSLCFVSLTLSGCREHHHTAFWAGTSLSYSSVKAEFCQTSYKACHLFQNNS